MNIEKVYVNSSLWFAPLKFYDLVIPTSAGELRLPFEKKSQADGNFLTDLDPMFEDAARVIVRHQQGSVSLLQRRLKLGYSRAARIVDQLEEAGIVGGSEGSKAREVKIENEQQLDTLLRAL